jgi:hypothetical protein
MASNAKLNLVRDHHQCAPPPKPLGPAGAALWGRISAEYLIDDEAARQLLWLACNTEDTRSQLSDAVARDGAVVTGRYGPRAHPALREELACRAFISKTIERLGLNLELVCSPGNPGSGGLGVDWGK